MERCISYNAKTHYYFPDWREAGGAWMKYVSPKTGEIVRFRTRQAAENFINRRGGIRVEAV